MAFLLAVLFCNPQNGLPSVHVRVYANGGVQPVAHSTLKTQLDNKLRPNHWRTQNKLGEKKTNSTPQKRRLTKRECCWRAHIAISVFVLIVSPPNFVRFWRLASVAPRARLGKKLLAVEWLRVEFEARRQAQQGHLRKHKDKKRSGENEKMRKTENANRTAIVCF